MNEKFDLQEMLNEIKEDEAAVQQKNKGGASQEMIKKMLLKRLNKEEKGHAG